MSDEDDLPLFMLLKLSIFFNLIAAPQRTFRLTINFSLGAYCQYVMLTRFPTHHHAGVFLYFQYSSFFSLVRVVNTGTKKT